jgi:hypothetical protein
VTDAALLASLALVRDKLVVAIADVERGDHLRAADAIDEAAAVMLEAIEELRAAA